MKHLLLFSLLLVSCANRRIQVKRHADEAVQSGRRIETTLLSNSELSEELTIRFRSVEFDTAGRKTKETTGEISRQKAEVKNDSVVRRDSVQTDTVVTVMEQTEEKKTRSWNCFLTGIIAAAVLFLLAYSALKRRDWKKP